MSEISQAAKDAVEDIRFPLPVHIEHIVFEGRDCAVLSPEEYETLHEHARTLESQLVQMTKERDEAKGLLS